MPSPLHETLVEMFRHRPDLAAELLAALGCGLPAHDAARTDSGDLPDLAPTEYRADNVVELTRDGTAVGAVVVEVQLRADEDKRWSWPVYLTTLRARLRGPVVLLVVCNDARTAAWSAEPIELGHPGAHIAPVVLGPDRIPVIDDPAVAARMPELAVLSALTHGSEPGREAVLEALAVALASTDADHALLYSDLVQRVLPAALRRLLEDKMGILDQRPRPYQSDFARKYYGQGWADGETEGTARGRAVAVLQVLESRQVSLSPAERLRIVECRDLAQLDTWVLRAGVVGSAEELFA